ncbi:type II toxin-antitoxin system RelE/ParE family toxin [Mucilaginibacter sp. 21P]|uniref:type II toxin-antitoxin system RelE/ParE family toxin n=1 Tax=Mucilaginibacter sp. 21P TaxID=2778902 RepID=UPI001C752916|nr:type II toxin-antitoxin system RelE/ParE family toxin [Mucilaginibacter sp. 21P]
MQILYTDTAKQTLLSTYDFIKNQFGEKSAKLFADKADKTIKLLAEYPLMFKASDLGPNVRVGMITKQCSLFYRVTETEIHLLFFWDNRQEPLSIFHP